MERIIIHIKKIFLILLLYLFNSSANAGLKEIGSSYVSQETKDKINAQLKNRPKSEKVILYFYTDGEHNQVWDSGGANEITDKLHEEVFKRCNKQIKKYIKIEAECSLYFLDNKVVWKFASENPIDTKATKNIIAKRIILEKDKKPGRFFEDQPDVNDDYQIHFNYLLAQDSEDREFDINGKMEKIILMMNKWMEKSTKKNRKGDKVPRKYKLDYRSDGKLDITFIRMDKNFNQLHKSANNDITPFLYKNIGQKNNKKIYFNFADINSVDGGEAGIGFGSIFLRNKSVKTNKRKAAIALHELLHTQGMGTNCMPWIKSSDLKSHSSHLKNYDQRTMLNSVDPSSPRIGKIYAHNIDKCPQFMDSVYLTPTREDPYDPYKIFCLFELGKYEHPNYLYIIRKLKKAGKYNWKTRFASSCKTRDNRKDSQGYYLFGVEGNILQKINY